MKMGKKKADIKDQVEQRRKAETKARAARAKPVAVKQLEISDEHLLGYLNENRVGDAKLYCRLHRDTVIYVKYWERFLIWGGHHWIEDDYEAAFQRIEEVCEPGMACSAKTKAWGRGASKWAASSLCRSRSTSAAVSVCRAQSEL